jgi:hypothetical protein
VWGGSHVRKGLLSWSRHWHELRDEGAIQLSFCGRWSLTRLIETRINELILVLGCRWRLAALCRSLKCTNRLGRCVGELSEGVPVAMEAMAAACPSWATRFGEF